MGHNTFENHFDDSGVITKHLTGSINYHEVEMQETSNKLSSSHGSDDIKKKIKSIGSMNSHLKLGSVRNVNINQSFADSSVGDISIDYSVDYNINPSTHGSF